MRLSHIKLAGFKSFVDPTHIALPGQVVGIVGPNGCGKSNVIDALRWVLGESKASALRGESMQDVIFNGSSKRKAVSRASVELIFDNSLGKAAGQWSSYAEISIKRVLQRDGKSGYYINNQQVRRKDITDIFLGTGLGARAYAIIEQGMISRIIEAKPEELRVFLEEAAGVSRYRDRRRETELRIRDTRDNLLRVNDVLQELAGRLEHLAEQAKVAQQYQTLKQQRDTTQQLFWLLKKQEAELQQQTYAGQVSATRNQLEAETARLRQLEAELETCRSRHFQFSDELHQKQGELYSVNAEIARLEQQRKHEAEQQQRIQRQLSDTHQQLSQQQQQRATLHELLQHWGEQQQEGEMRLAEAEEQAELHSQQLPMLEHSFKQAQQDHQQAQRQQLQLQQQIALFASQQNNTQRNIQQLQSRRDRLQQEQHNLQAPDRELLDELQLQLECLQAEQAEFEIQQQQLQTAIPPADMARRESRQRLQQQERQLAQSEAKLKALSALQQQLDSNQQLNRWLQQQGLQNSARLWQRIQIAAGWERALESVLREALNALLLDDLSVVQTWPTLPPARLALCQVDANNSPFIAMEPVANRTPLWQHVRCDDSALQPALQAALAGYDAVDSLAIALQKQAELPLDIKLITPDGHLITRYGVTFYAADNPLHGVLERQREISELAQQVECLQAEQQTLQQQLQQAEQDYQQLEQQLAPLRNALNRSQQQIHQQQLQLLKQQQLQDRFSERQAQLQQELTELAQQQQQEQQSGLEWQAEAERCFEQQEQQEQSLRQLAQQAEQQEQALREQRLLQQHSQQVLQEARFFGKTCRDKLSDIGNNLRQLDDQIEHLQQRQQELEVEVMEQQQQDLMPLLQQALAQKQLAEAGLSEARQQLEHATQNLQALDQARLGCELALDPLRNQVNELILKEQEARLYVEQWQSNLAEVDEAQLLLKLASENAKPQVLQQNLKRLDNQIEALGAVNLAALEELNAASERKNYLEAQAEDLNAALSTLEEAIRRIDRESRDLLMATFNEVNGHLAQKFPVLFNGGEAKLVMTGEEILDSGVQVMAQPPGKKNSSIHLMSGGEKALTAIALVFSLFQLNPAPFCLLDEVDAPLDDTNTERLCKLIKTMAEGTQFIFISHNKITMELAEQLVGVTMQEQGVSRVVTVDMQQAIEMVGH